MKAGSGKPVKIKKVKIDDLSQAGTIVIDRGNTPSLHLAKNQIFLTVPRAVGQAEIILSPDEFAEISTLCGMEQQKDQALANVEGNLEPDADKVLGYEKNSDVTQKGKNHQKNGKDAEESTHDAVNAVENFYDQVLQEFISQVSARSSDERPESQGAKSANGNGYGHKKQQARANEAARPDADNEASEIAQELAEEVQWLVDTSEEGSEEGSDIIAEIVEDIEFERDAAVQDVLDTLDEDVAAPNASDHANSHKKQSKNGKDKDKDKGKIK